MDSRLLQYFLAVAREGTISDAARSLHVSQPTLSRQIKDLENSLGCSLFERGSGRGATLTPEGLRFRKRAEEIVDLMEKTSAEFRNQGQEVGGEVRIGGGETPGMGLIANMAQQVRRDHPAVTFHLYSGNAEDVMERLDAGRLDFGLFVGSANLAKYESVELPAKDEWGVLMRPDDPLSEFTVVSPQQLKDEPLILSRQALGEMEEWFGCSRKRLDIVATFNLLYNACWMVRAGMGYVISLKGIVPTDGPDDLVFRPLDPARSATLTMAWRKYQTFSPAASLFQERLLACKAKGMLKGKRPIASRAKEKAAYSKALEDRHKHREQGT